MIVTKSSLLAVGIVKRDKDLPKLDNVLFEPDGTVIACARNIVFAVSPPDLVKVRDAPVNGSGSLDAPVIVPANYVRAVVKEVKTDKTFGGLLEYVNLRLVHEATEPTAMFSWIHDGTPQYLSADLYGGAYIPYRKILSRSLSNLRMTPIRVKMNRARLKTLCDTFDKVAPNDTEAPVYIEFSIDGDMIMRAVNVKTNQRVVAVMTHYTERGGDWLSYDEWEDTLRTGQNGRPVARRERRPIARRERR